MVELLRRYSSRESPLKLLVNALERIRAADQTDEPGVQNTASCEPWRLGDRLSPTDVAQLIAGLRAGTAKHVLADRYNISISSVKRLLRKLR